MSRPLLSTLIALVPDADAVLPRSTGYLAYSALLKLLRDAAPALAEDLHGASPAKPFTLSALNGPFVSVPGKKGICLARQGRVFTLRVTSLDDALAAILQGWAKDGGSFQVQLGDAAFRATFSLPGRDRREGEVAETTYESLASRWLGEPEGVPRTLQMDFISPTTFRTGKTNLPLPLPDLVFGSLARKWVRFAPPELAEEVANRISIPGSSSPPGIPANQGVGASSPSYAQSLFLSAFELETRLLQFGSRIRQVGFLGAASFSGINSVPPEAGAALCLLADFSFFAGVGYRTTWGMGQTRPRIGEDGPRQPSRRS